MTIAWLYLLAYVLTGALAGILAGLLGVGGGVIIVPILSYLFERQGFPTTVHLALGTSLGTIAFTSLSSSRAHYRRGAVDLDIVKRITPGILIGTFLGGLLASHMATVTLKFVFSIFLLLVAAQLLSDARPRATRSMPQVLGMSGAGMLIGTVSGLVGIGGGSLSVPFMLWCNVEVRRAVGTSAAIGFPIAVAGAFSYLIHGLGVRTGVPHAVGYLHLPALAGVAVASVLTAPVGARIAAVTKPARLKRGFACLLFATSLKMLWTAIA